MSNCADPARLSPGERLREAAAILAAGVLRLRQRAALPAENGRKNPAEGDISQRARARAAELANGADWCRRPPRESAATAPTPPRTRTSKLRTCGTLQSDRTWASLGGGLASKDNEPHCSYSGSGSYRAKRLLVLGLYDLGYNADEVRETFRLLDWMMLYGVN